MMKLQMFQEAIPQDNLSFCVQIPSMIQMQRIGEKWTILQEHDPTVEQAWKEHAP
jgi:hypothetical protein